MSVLLSVFVFCVVYVCIVVVLCVWCLWCVCAAVCCCCCFKSFVFVGGMTVYGCGLCVRVAAFAVLLLWLFVVLPV